MLENFNASTELKFKELSPEEKASRGILGRLYGPIADIVRSTRNGRRYTESLWEKVFENPITKEMYAQGGVPGELDHPADREETCSEKIAIMMPEPPTKDKDGHLVGYFDIIDTPCGRIAYALAKYGFNLGISSRGSGDTFMGDDGEEMVDEDTYSFNAFDLVLLPACKDARLQLAESLDVKKNRFDKAIKEAIDKADEGEKKIMTETLENLKFFEDTSSENEEEKKSNEVEANEEVGSTKDELVESLQEALRDNQALQKQVIALQEKLSVSYTKEINQGEKITKLEDAVKKLTESVGKLRAYKTQVGTMQTQLNDQVRKNEEARKLLESYKSRLSSIGAERRSLNESVSSKDEEISSLRERVSTLKESYVEKERENTKLVESLKDTISELKQDSEIKNKQYSHKLKKSNDLIESYRKIAKTSLDKYIECKATQLGISTTEIKNKLNENYTFNEIDKVCEDLRSYKRNMSKLPFSLSSGNVSKVALKESVSTNKSANPDDVVDQNLFDLLNT